jgi:hypothetical protein
MKLAIPIRMLVLILLFGTSAMIYAQDQQDNPKPPQTEPRPEETKPAGDEVKPSRQQQEEAKPPKQDEAKPPKQDEAKPPKQDEAKLPKQDASKPARAQQSNHIPDDKFRAHFGRQHTLVISRPTVVEGQPRFQYGGYSFIIIDPWPAGWAYTDQCYIDYIDGEYFLFDLLHPGVRIALSVVL